jgi:hypothetical protein
VIKYEKRKLELVLPQLVVYNTTVATLRNLLAHEQSRDDKKPGKVAMYAVLMDSLIDTTHDLAILTDAKVLTNHLGRHFYQPSFLASKTFFDGDIEHEVRAFDSNLY